MNTRDGRPTGRADRPRALHRADLPRHHHRGLAPRRPMITEEWALKRGAPEAPTVPDRAHASHATRSRDEVLKARNGRLAVDLAMMIRGAVWPCFQISSQSIVRCPRGCARAHPSDSGVEDRARRPQDPA